jgi:hypothetical protein
MMHEWLKGKTIEEIAAIEHGGRTLFPDKIQRVKPDGSFEGVEVYVRVPRTVEVMQARQDAREFFRKRKIDPKEDNDLFEQLDTFAVLARAIRDKAPPHDQFQPLEFLLSNDPGKGFDTESLLDVWTRLEVYRKMIDPRVTVVSEDDALRAAYEIDRCQNISPLAGIAGHELDSCIFTMANLLVRYRTLLLASQSGESGGQAS